ncbi:MAG: (2Fe-2S) ferredoxin domain-containing protein [Alkalispirochaeta sp.]
MKNEPSPTRIELCMGSSCFARGNREALSLVMQYLESTDQRDSVDLRGHLCADSCSHGPVLKVAGTRHTDVTPEGVLEIVKHWCQR